MHLVKLGKPGQMLLEIPEFSGSWNSRVRRGQDQDLPLPRENLINDLILEEGVKESRICSWCYRFGLPLNLGISCQSPGSVSFRHPIRGVVTARSPSLIPRSNSGSWSESCSLKKANSVLLQDSGCLDLPLISWFPEDDSASSQWSFGASLFCSCLPVAPEFDLKYITG